MAPQFPVAGLRGRTALTAWRAYHLFYHGDRDRLVAGLVRPTVAALLGSGEIYRFYFMRYGLGGPHVRLRVLPVPGRAEVVGERVLAEAAAFFTRFPSMRTLPDETVRRHNRELVPGDPYANGAEDLVLPDNSVREHPPQLEVERYGGRPFLGHSLDFFTLSSVDAFRFLDNAGSEPTRNRLAGALRLLVRQAWGLAAGADEFMELAGYHARFFTAGPLARFLATGDEAFERQAGMLHTLLHNELTALAAGPASRDSPRWTAEAARSLAQVTRRLDSGRKWHLAASQLHMTANRLGLVNAEEVYLGRILWRAARSLAASDPTAWRDLWDAHCEQRTHRMESLSWFVEAALAELAATSRGQGPTGDSAGQD